MKKTLSIILATLTLAAMSTTVLADDTGLVSTAAKATVAPVIDGQIDEIWDYTEAQTVNTSASEGVEVSAAYTKILWDDTGLYFLAVVTDDSITEKDADARNSVDFWISEKNTKTDGFDADAGDWHFCKASDGTECYYTGNEKIYDVAESYVDLTADGYVIEFYAPFLSDITPAVGTKIGYTVSVNDDVDGDGVRDGYSYWSVTADDGAYWSNTKALCDVTLVDGPVFAEETVAEVVADDVVTTAPQTFDAGVIAAVAVIVSAACYAIAKKR